MGKHPPSLIHDKYSDWHYNHLMEINPKYKNLYMVDIDRFIWHPETEGYRLWTEWDFMSNSPVAAMDLKWAGTLDTMTKTEEGLASWLEKNKCPFFILRINFEFTEFNVTRWISKKNKTFNEIEYADWLLSLRTHIYQTA